MKRYLFLSILCLSFSLHAFDDELQAERENIGNFNAAYKIIASLKSQGSASENKEPNKYAHFVSPKQYIFQEIKHYHSLIKKDHDIPFRHVLKLCLQAGHDDELPNELLRKIIIKYPNCHDELAEELIANSSLYNFGFNLYNPMAHYDMNDEPSQMQFLRLMAQQGHEPSRKFHNNFFKQKKQEVAELKKSRQEHKAQRAREEQLKKEQDIMHAQYLEACNLIKQDKTKEYREADIILQQLCEKGYALAFIKRGKIFQEKTIKSRIQSGTSKITNNRNNSRRKAHNSQKINNQIIDQFNNNLQLTLNSFARAGELGNYYIGKLYEKLWHLEEDGHKSLSEAMFQQSGANMLSIAARCIKNHKDHTKGIDLLADATSSEQIKEAYKLAKNAETHYKQVAKKDSNAYTNLGLLYAQVGSSLARHYKNKAKEAFDQTQATDPNYVKALRHRALIHTEEAEAFQAIEILKKACTVDPNCPKSFEALDEICKLLIQEPFIKTEVLRELGNFFIKFNYPQKGYLILGRSASQDEKYDEAIKLYIKAGEAGSEQGYFYAAHLSKHANNQPALAKKYLKKAIALNDQKPQTLFMLGKIYETNENNLDKAVHYYQKAADLKCAQAHFALAQYYHYGKNGIYDLTLATTHYEGAAALALKNQDRKNIKKYSIFAQITKLQCPNAVELIEGEEGQAIQNLIVNLLNTKPMDSDEDGKAFVAEAHLAQANLHSICVEKTHNAIKDIKQAIEELKQDPKRSEDVKELISSCIKEHKSLNENIVKALEHQQKALVKENDYRTMFIIAESFAELCMNSKINDMSEKEKVFYKSAKALFSRIIKKCSIRQPNSYFLQKAKENLIRMYQFNEPEKMQELLDLLENTPQENQWASSSAASSSSSS